MLNLKKTLSLILALTMCVLLIAGCSGEEKVTAPQNLIYNKSDGSFSFDALDGAETYIVGVSKIINDTTGQALQPINQASALTLPDGTTVYLWSEQTGSVAGLADNDNDGAVNGTVIYREFSSSAETVGAVIKDLSKLPVGHYVLQAIASATDELPNPEAAYFEFTIPGTLQTPSGFVAQINEAGYMQIDAASGYYLSCLTATGMPTKMVFEIMDGSTVVETIEVNDFSYTNTVLGPAKSFTFTHGTVTGTVALDKSKTYTVKVTAVGDGSEILDASAETYIASTTPAVMLATKYDQSGSGTAGDYSISLNLGLDEAGNKIYELTASVNNVAILRESGTYTATVEGVDEAGNPITVDAEPQDAEGKLVYPEGTVLTFTTTQSDAAAPILDGVTLTAAMKVTESWGRQSISYYLDGTASVEGVSFNFEAASGGRGGPGGS